jgi:hypothetical protein
VCCFVGLFETCKDSFRTSQRTHRALLETSVGDVRGIMVEYFDNHARHIG